MRKFTINSLFFLSIGIITSYYYKSLAFGGNIAYVLAAIAVATAFASLYLGRLADKNGTHKLTLLFIPISAIAIFFMQTFVGQIIFALSSTLITLLIEISTSNLHGKSGDKFGKLSFYVQMSYAVSILVGGFISDRTAIIISIGLLVLFFIFQITPNTRVDFGSKPHSATLL